MTRDAQLTPEGIENHVPDRGALAATVTPPRPDAPVSPGWSRDGG